MYYWTSIWWQISTSFFIVQLVTEDLSQYRIYYDLLMYFELIGVGTQRHSCHVMKYMKQYTRVAILWRHNKLLGHSKRLHSPTTPVQIDRTTFSYTHRKLHQSNRLSILTLTYPWTKNTFCLHSNLLSIISLNINNCKLSVHKNDTALSNV